MCKLLIYSILSCFLIINCDASDKKLILFDKKRQQRSLVRKPKNNTLSPIHPNKPYGEGRLNPPFDIQPKKRLPSPAPCNTLQKRNADETLLSVPEGITNLAKGSDSITEGEHPLLFFENQMKVTEERNILVRKDAPQGKVLGEYGGRANAMEIEVNKIDRLAEAQRKAEEGQNSRIFGKMTSKNDVNSSSFTTGRDMGNKSNTKYYGELDTLARDARNGDLKAIKEIQSIVNNPKKHIKDTNIRVRAKLYDGSLRGCGQDEAFRTAATYEFLKRSAGLVEGVEPFSLLSDGREYTWLDAQRDIRFSTAIVLFLNGNAHTGALYGQPCLNKQGNPSLKGQLTIGGKVFHDARHVEILRSSTPISATARAIRFMIDNTPTTSEFLSGEMYDKDTYTIFGENLKTLEGRFSFVNELVVFRNRLKLVFEQYKEYLKNECTTQTEAPSLRDAETYIFSQMDNLEQRLIKLEDLGSPPVND